MSGRSIKRASGRSGQRLLEPQNQAVEKTEFAGHPSEPVGEDQRPNKKKQRAAKHLDGVEMLSKALIEAQKLTNAESGEQKGNGESRGVHREEQDAARDRVAGSSERQHRGENGADAGGPAEGECETEKKTAPDSRLRAAGAEANVAIEPASHGGAEETDQGKREEMNRAQTTKKRATAEKSNYAQGREQATENEPGLNG